MSKKERMTENDLLAKGMEEVSPGVFKKKSNGQPIEKIIQKEIDKIKPVIENIMSEKFNDLVLFGETEIHDDLIAALGIAVMSSKKPKKTPHKKLQEEQYNKMILSAGALIKTSFTSDEHHLVFKWAGKGLSLNEWYESKHWTQRNKIAEEWHMFFKKFLIQPYPRFDKYEIILTFNSRLDASNVITKIKLLEDLLQKEKIIENDNNKYCRGLHIIPDLTMKKNSYCIIVKNITE